MAQPTHPQPDELEIVRQAIMPALSSAAVGEFKLDIELSDKHSRRVNETLMGVQVLLEVIREKMLQLEEANAKLEEAHDRSVAALDEVLEKTTPRPR